MEANSLLLTCWLKSDALHHTHLFNNKGKSIDQFLKIIFPGILLSQIIELLSIQCIKVLEYDFLGENAPWLASVIFS